MEELPPLLPSLSVIKQIEQCGIFSVRIRACHLRTFYSKGIDKGIKKGIKGSKLRESIDSPLKKLNYSVNTSRIYQELIRVNADLLIFNLPLLCFFHVKPWTPSTIEPHQNHQQNGYCFSTGNFGLFEQDSRTKKGGDRKWSMPGTQPHTCSGSAAPK